MTPARTAYEATKTDEALAVRIVRHEEDLMTGDTIIWLSDGRACRFDRREIQRGSIEAWSASMGILPSSERVDVIQYGRKVGELPAMWTPMLAKSSSFLYDYRHGDLTLRDGKWYASKTLGGGDLDCLIGFIRKDSVDEAPAPKGDV